MCSYIDEKDSEEWIMRNTFQSVLFHAWHSKQLKNVISEREYKKIHCNYFPTGEDICGFLRCLLSALQIVCASSVILLVGLECIYSSFLFHFSTHKN